MEFLRSFLRRNLVGKPVVASPNVGCFLRLIYSFHQKRNLFVAPNKIKLRYVLVLAILSRAIMGAFLPITQEEELMRWQPSGVTRLRV